MHHGLVTENSRKARAAKSLYDTLRSRAKGSLIPSFEWETIQGIEGVPVQQGDKYRVLNLRLQDEHLSPYFKTDMNLFHMLMMDDSANVTIFRSDQGWLFVFEGIPDGPKPFGQNGFDMR